MFSMIADYHSLIVEAALRTRGNDVFRFCIEDLPKHADIEFHYDRTSSRLALHAMGSSVLLDEIDVVWNRRSRWPVLPAAVTPEDREFCEKQLKHVKMSLQNLFGNAFWANSEVAGRHADAKPLQLRLAPTVGLAIPDTLISNRPEAIRAFLRRYEKVVHKPLVGHVWSEDGRCYSSYTSSVKSAELPADAMLRAAPGIFQCQVPKSHEVRAQFLGDTCLAISIDSSRLDYGEFDWRRAQRSLGFAPAIQLPPAVHKACRDLMRTFGIVCGAFDFIVTPEGEWIFLEVNEGGQFLFLETLSPGIPVLDAYCSFLESMDPEFRYQEPLHPMRLADMSKTLPAELALSADQLLRQEDTAIRETLSFRQS
ncbi:MAG: hypothetical protein COS34_08870 [Lysobacterales bacterium CG02_land_8_20_14_3_00_62_12]|nr:MAG: hypothetical protein COS34_08870 [Xanthomonadales bacterium CG02_land_8_20_14_3_00_62_12]